MNSAYDSREIPLRTGYRSTIMILLWISLSTGWFVSLFSVIEEMCLATACRDTAAFTVFGFNMGWFGIAYFSLILIVLWKRKSELILDWVLSALVYCGIGAELRLLWIQKYVIEGWCPLCVTICCALVISAILLAIEKVQGMGAGEGYGKHFLWWTAFVSVMVAAGLGISVVGIKALT